MLTSTEPARRTPEPRTILDSLGLGIRPVAIAFSSRPEDSGPSPRSRRYPMSDDTPRILVDSDWKAEAQAEKQRLVEVSAKKEAPKSDLPPDPNAPLGLELPPADFKGLMGVLASQAIMGLGAYTDPQTGGVVIDLPGAKFAIDLLAILEEKTVGNISDEEADELSNILIELRSRFVQIAQLVAQQAAAGVGPDGIPTGGNPADIPNLRIEEP